MPATLEEALAQVQQMVGPAEFTNEVSGFGPGGFLEVSDRVKSIQYFLNMKWLTARRRSTRDNVFLNEFVWDPINLRFCTLSASGKGPRLNGSPHQSLARSINADENSVCGGSIFRPDNDNALATLNTMGVLHVSELSGHFGRNWTDPIRAQFARYMHFRTGLIIQNDGYNE